jgi:Glycosyl transferase family 11
MITCQLIGGLGNQLFQIATTLALAWENQDLAIFDLNGHHQLSQGNKAIHYKTTVYRNLIDRQIPPCKYIFKERGFHYQPIVYQSGMQLVGFFQSEKYFVKYRQYLLDILKPKSQIIDELKSKYEFILERPNCAMHIRRGDYVNRTQYNPICSLDYYQQAVDLFPRDTAFLIFSDDLEWCKQTFDSSRFTFAEFGRTRNPSMSDTQASENNSSAGYLPSSEEVDLYLMSMCQHQIIANSTFSWWGSWLNQNPHKRIVAPKTWFGSGLRHLNADDIYTESMLKI